MLADRLDAFTILSVLLQIVDTDHLVCGSDFPYAPQYACSMLAEALENTGLLTNNDKRAIYSGNASGCSLAFRVFSLWEGFSVEAKLSGPRSKRSLSTFRALRYRNFRLLWTGLLVSNAGTWMQMVAQGWLVYELTGSAFYLGLVGLMQAVPRFAFSLFGGVAADRLERKRFLCFTQTASMTLAFALAALAYTHLIRVWQILSVSFLNSLVMTFDQPARQALVSDLVEGEDLVNAIALNSMAFNGAAVFGPSLGGLLLATIGAPGCFFRQRGELFGGNRCPCPDGGAV